MGTLYIAAPVLAIDGGKIALHRKATSESARAAVLQPADLVLAQQASVANVVLDGVAPAFLSGLGLTHAGAALQALIGAFQARGAHTVAVQLFPQFDAERPVVQAALAGGDGVDAAAARAAALDLSVQQEDVNKWAGFAVYR